MKRRSWRGAAGLLAALAVAGCGPPGGAGSAPSPTARCQPEVLTLAYGPQLSPMTGEHGVLIELVNRGRLACTLTGYPEVTLYAGGRPLPFRYTRGGGPYVTRAAPVIVTLRPGGTAWALIAKYRCDLGIIRDATTLRLTVPGAAFTRPLPETGGRVSDLSYCRGGPGDPGQVVAVSPIESSPRSTAG
jgi:hypothetical protein